MEHGILRVNTPDGQVREYPLESPTLTLGRSRDSGITVDHVSVSRRHAQIKIEDGKFFVQDLGSAAGTFVGSQRIGTDEPYLVEDGQVVRFGDCEARFLTEDTSVADLPTSSVTTPEGQATIAVSLASPAQPIAPGAASTATVVIQNRGKVLDTVTLSVPDLPPEWVQVRRPQLSLAPGARDEVTIVLQPPKKPEATAGEHEFAVAAMSSEQGREVRVLGRMTLLPFEGFKFSLKGPQNKDEFLLNLENTGNAQTEYVVAVADEEEKLNYTLESERVVLEPGTVKQVKLKVAPKRKNPFGQDAFYRFQATARPASGGTETGSAWGNFAYRAPFKRWKYFVGAILGISILSTGAILQRAGALPDLFGGSSSDPTPTVAVTATIAGETPEPTAAGTPTIEVGGRATIVNSPPGDCLRVRRGPTTAESDPDSTILGQLCDGQTVDVTDGPDISDGFIWWRIDDGAGLEGWAAEGPEDGSTAFMVVAD